MIRFELRAGGKREVLSSSRGEASVSLWEEFRKMDSSLAFLTECGVSHGVGQGEVEALAVRMVRKKEHGKNNRKMYRREYVLYGGQSMAVVIVIYGTMSTVWARGA